MRVLTASVALLLVCATGCPQGSPPPAAGPVDEGFPPPPDGGSGAPLRLPSALPPRLLALVPGSRAAGEAVTVRGEFFGAEPSTLSVTVAGAAAALTSASPSELTVRLPAAVSPGATTLTVRTPAGSADLPLEVTAAEGGAVDAPALSITGLEPRVFRPGGAVRVLGSGFGAVAAEHRVRIAGVQALVRAVEPGALIIEAPALAQSGPLVVERGLSRSNPIEAFMTQPPPPVSTVLEQVGARARDYLSAERHTHLVVELDHSPELPPTPEVLTLVASRVMERVNKPGGLVFVIRPELPSRPGWTLEQVSQAEVAHRDHYGTGSVNTAVYYVAYLSDDAAHAAAGYAYSATSMVVFKGRHPPAGEALIAVHEFGHNLGLVNRGTPPVSDHEDRAHGAHDVSDACVMFWNPWNTQGAATLAFDAACIADIRANGGR